MAEPRFFKYWGWGDTWLVFLIVLGVSLAVLGGVAITADHSIRYYYVDWQYTDRMPVPCIKSYREWWSDDIVYCTQDTDRLTGMLRTLTENLHTRR